MQEHEKLVERFADKFREIILKNEEDKKKLRNRLEAENRKNIVLQKKLRHLYDNPEINSSELYLVNKIERLERELRNANELVALYAGNHQLTKYRPVDNSEMGTLG